MNRFMIVLTNRKNLIICLLATFFIIVSAFIIAGLSFPKEADTESSAARAVISLENENSQLKDILSTIIPMEDKILYENNRKIDIKYSSSDQPDISAADIINKGKNLSYIFVYSDEEYLRPIYSSTWKQTYYQGWLYLPRKVLSARHSLFTYTGGAGKIFDIEGDLGFYPNVSIDNQNYINFMVYNFDITNVFQAENQIVITGTPLKKGVHIISIKIDDLNIQDGDSEYISARLCTPSGCEIDYQNIQFSKFSNKYTDDDIAGKINKDLGDNDEDSNYNTADDTEDAVKNDIYDAQMQNHQLHQELTHFISDSSKPIYFQYSGSYQTAVLLNSNVDLEEAAKYANNINYNLLYDNKKYVRPVFHPKWKANYDKEWCYIPRKMYLNMKKLFVLPADKDIAGDLCGELGFFEKYKAVEKNHIGLLINNFSVSNISVYEDNIMVEGIPSRSGVQIVSISKTNLTDYGEYAVRLVTKDHCELDVDVMSNK